MKRVATISAALLALALTGCDQVKNLGANAKPKAASTAPKKFREPDIRELQSAQDLDDFIKTPDRLIVVQFHADWCPYSTELAPSLKIVASDFAGQASVGIVDSAKLPDLIKREKVDSYPRVRFYRDGKLVEEVSGIVKDHATEMMTAFFAKHAEGVPEVYHEKPATPPPAPGAPAQPAEPAIQPMKKDWAPPGMEKRKHRA